MSKKKKEPEKLFLIRYNEGGNPIDLYWDAISEEWVRDPESATKLPLVHAHTQVGKILIDFETRTCLVDVSNAKPAGLFCVECGERLGRFDNENSHTNPRDCIRALKERLGEE